MNNLTRVAHAVLSVMLMVDAALAATSRQAEMAALDQAVQSRGSSGLTAELSDVPASREVAIGKSLELKLGSASRAYVALVYIDSHGVADIYQPVFGNSGNLLEKNGSTYYSGTEGQPWQVRPPAGPTAIYVIASAEPLSSLSAKVALLGPHYLVSEADAQPFLAKVAQEIGARAPGSVALQRIDFEAHSAGGEEYSVKEIVQYFTQTTRSVDRPRLDLHVNFASNSAEIEPNSLKALDVWGRVLSDPLMAGQKFVLGGNTDDIGGEGYNLELSKRRAQAVRDYLVKHYSVDPASLQPEGFGMSRPIQPGTDDKTRALNRRVDFERVSRPH